MGCSSFEQRVYKTLTGLGGKKRTLNIFLETILFNPEAVIVEGKAKDSSVYDFSSELQDACKDAEITEMDKFPWGIHTTLIRNLGVQEGAIAEGQELYQTV